MTGWRRCLGPAALRRSRITFTAPSITDNYVNIIQPMNWLATLIMCLTALIFNGWVMGFPILYREAKRFLDGTHYEHGLDGAYGIGRTQYVHEKLLVRAHIGTIYFEQVIELA